MRGGLTQESGVLRELRRVDWTVGIVLPGPPCECLRVRSIVNVKLRQQEAGGDVATGMIVALRSNAPSLKSSIHYRIMRGWGIIGSWALSSNPSLLAKPDRDAASSLSLDRFMLIPAGVGAGGRGLDQSIAGSICSALTSPSFLHLFPLPPSPLPVLHHLTFATSSLPARAGISCRQSCLQHVASIEASMNCLIPIDEW